MSEQNGNLGQRAVEKREVNRLKDAERYPLWEALKKNAPMFHSKKFSLKEAAEFLANELGFPVTEHHVAGACKTIGVTWKRKRNRLSMQGRVYKDRLRILAKDFADFVRGFGHPIPEGTLLILQKGRGTSTKRTAGNNSSLPTA